MIFFKNTPDKNDSDIILFEAYEGDNVLGNCYLSLKNEYAEIFKLSYNKESPHIVEGLLRSAFNYAALRNFYMGKCTAQDIDVFLKRMNFEYKDGEYINDIPSILMGSCSCC